MPDQPSPVRQCGRRLFLAKGLAAGAALAGGPVAPALVARPARAGIRLERALRFHNIHTKESLSVVYWRNGQVLPEARHAIDHHLRDFRTDDVIPIDVRLLDLLTKLNLILDNRWPLHVISGYRSPETNAMLAARSSRVAKNSFHMYGRAIDIRLPGCALTDLRDAAVSLQAGGVGYYPESAFVHVDTGPLRTW